MRATDATIDNRDNHLDMAGQRADRLHRTGIGVDQTGRHPNLIAGPVVGPCAIDDGRVLWGTRR
jgi:hypothetical protein